MSKKPFGVGGKTTPFSHFLANGNAWECGRSGHAPESTRKNIRYHEGTRDNDLGKETEQLRDEVNRRESIVIQKELRITRRVLCKYINPER